jgi:DNA polymerase delta subunit 1
MYWFAGRKACEEGIELMGKMYQLRTYEANIDFEIRFMVDAHISGCCWIEVPAHTYQIIKPDRMISRCQLEVGNFVLEDNANSFI